jgi:hypothetical protein
LLIPRENLTLAEEPRLTGKIERIDLDLACWPTLTKPMSRLEIIASALRMAVRRDDGHQLPRGRHNAAHGVNSELLHGASIGDRKICSPVSWSALNGSWPSSAI